MPNQPVVFIGYSRQDETEKDRLLTHLGVLQQEGLINLWSDDQIGTGVAWEAEISQTIARATVALLLISADFLNSDFILGQVVPPLLERQEREGLLVFPVIAKHCAWQTVEWLAKMKVRPINGQPIWREVGIYADKELTIIAKEIAALVKKDFETASTPGKVQQETPTMIEVGPPADSHKTIAIPLELAEELAKGNVILFCGEGISTGVGQFQLKRQQGMKNRNLKASFEIPVQDAIFKGADGLPDHYKLAQALTQDADLGDAGSRSLPEVAQSYQVKMGRNRLLNKIVQWVKYDQPYKPLPAHHLIASLPFKRIITTNWDELLERALEQANTPCIRVVTDAEVPFVKDITLIKLHGSLERPESLIITSNDYFDVFARSPEITRLVGSYFATQTILFLGFSLTDPDFRQLYREVTRHVGQLKRRAYAIQPNPDPLLVKEWEQNNVQLINAGVIEFLETLKLEAG